MKVAALRRKCEGFTLAELLIAMMIFAIVVSLTYAAFTSTFQVIERASSSSEFAERGRITLDRIAEDLESLYFGEKGIFAGKETFSGELRGDSLSFTSTAHLIFHKEAAPAGYATISYSVEESENQGTLSLFRRDLAFLPEGQNDEERGFLLCDKLKEVAFTYIDEDGVEYNSWDSEFQKESDDAEIPRAVRIKLGFPDENNEDKMFSISTLVAMPRIK